MYVCVYVCVCGKFPSGLIKKAVRVTGLDFRYSTNKTLKKPMGKFYKNRPVVSGLIDGFVPEM